MKNRTATTRQAKAAHLPPAAGRLPRIMPKEGSEPEAVAEHGPSGENTAAFPLAMKRMTFWVPEPLYADLQGFAGERGDSMTGIIKWSLGVAKVIWDEIKCGNKIQVYSKDGTPLKELIFTRY